MANYKKFDTAINTVVESIKDMTSSIAESVQQEILTIDHKMDELAIVKQSLSEVLEALDVTSKPETPALRVSHPTRKYVARSKRKKHESTGFSRDEKIAAVYAVLFSRRNEELTVRQIVESIVGKNHSKYLTWQKQVSMITLQGEADGYIERQRAEPGHRGPGPYQHKLTNDGIAYAVQHAPATH